MLAACVELYNAYSCPFPGHSSFVLPEALCDRCVAASDATLPQPIAIENVPYVIWSDSTLACRPEKKPGVKKAPSMTKVPEYLKSVRCHAIRHHETCCGGKILDLLTWVRRVALAGGVQDCVFVAVWSFNDFFDTSTG